MSQLFEDKIIKIEKLMTIILDNFIRNISYGDIDNVVDELPFPHLYLSLKKKINELLIDLYIKNENGSINEIATALESFGVKTKDNRLVYPTYEYFKADGVEHSMIDLSFFGNYIDTIEGFLYNSQSYHYTNHRLYSSFECAGSRESMEHALSDKAELERVFCKVINDKDLFDSYPWADENYWVNGSDNYNDELCLTLEEALFSGEKEREHAPRITISPIKVIEGLSEKIVYDKNLLFEVISPDKIEDRVKGYSAFIKVAIDALLYKEYYDIPEACVTEILDSVYNRVLKATIVTTVNLYTRKADAKVKKQALKEAIRKSHSIGTDRWNRCTALYSEELFKEEDLRVIAKYIPKISEIIELM